ncbi:MAG: MOSC N-terminal beta barrel domain-containing protein, partial [Gemmatimonadota bacterium]
MHLSSLHIYPLKSAQGISVDSVELDDFGPTYDRRWMLIGPDRVVVTQREAHRLALVRVELDGGGLRISAPGAGGLEVGQGGEASPLVEVSIWSDRCLARDLGEEPASWFSRFLGDPIRLVFMPPESFRPVDPNYVDPPRRVSFADGFPLLLIGDGSLAELNRRLARPVPMNRFRPNVVLSGTEPFAEDGWGSVEIGSVVFDVVKPCARCVVTTIDQENAEPGREPLRTLATFRKRDDGVHFGQNLLHRGPGRLRIGDSAVATLKS